MEDNLISMVVTSDLHWHFVYTEIPECDIFCYCGDWSGEGRLIETIKFGNWIKKIKAKYKLIVPGNHEVSAYLQPDLARSIIEENGGIFLIDKAITIEGINFYGTPWSPRYGSWGFMRPDYDLKNIFKNIPKGTDILLSHTPPKGVLDLYGTNHIGSESLRKCMFGKNIKYHFFGHNHTPGVCKKRNIKYYNVSACNNDYEVINEPEVFYISITKKEDGNKKIKIFK